MTSVACRSVAVIATYNERENIERLLPEILGLSGELNVIVVDDGSPDGTGQAVEKIAGAHPGRVALIQRGAKLGYGSAASAGFRKALEDGAGFVISMDADYSHDPQSIPALVDGLRNADLAIGSRYVGGIRILNWSLRRLLLSYFANHYLNFLLRYGLSDCTSGFRAYRGDALRAIPFERAGARGYAFLVEILEMIARGGFRIAEVPIVYTERQIGRSKMSRGVIFEAAARPWRLLLRRISGKSY